MPKQSECCPVMQMALSREGKHGLQRAYAFDNKGKPAEPIVCTFPKAKRGSTGAFSYGTEYANVSYALVKFCPFCGKKQ